MSILQKQCQKVSQCFFVSAVWLVQRNKVLHFVTLDAQGPLSVVGQHEIRTGSMHAVARIAGHRTAVPGVSDISPEGMADSVLGRMTPGTKRNFFGPVIQRP